MPFMNHRSHHEPVDENATPGHESKTPVARGRRVLAITGIVLILAGASLAITGIVFMVTGDSYFGVNSRLWWEFSTTGGVLTFTGAACAMVGIFITGISRQGAMVSRVHGMIGLHSHDDTHVLFKKMHGMTPPPDPGTRIIEREIVKVRCAYCKTLGDLASGTCRNCGAPL